LPARTPTRSPLALALALLAAVALAAPGARAANWLASAALEPASAPAWRPFGFLSLEYQRTGGSPLAAGPWAGQDNVLNQIGPRLDGPDKLQVPYARIGVRGRLLDGKLSYLLTPLTGNNAVSRIGGGIVKVTDASVTLSLLPGARVRLGQFKHPSGEEAMREPPQQGHVNLTEVTAQLLQERFVDGDGAPPRDPNEDNGPASGFRDIGAQVFDVLRRGQWEHTYAVMVGQGNGLLRGDDNAGKDLYLYWSSERLLGPDGPDRDGLKLHAFRQSGERTLRAGPAHRERGFERTRYGLGASLHQGPWRAGLEWVGADGVIPNGTDGTAVPGTPSNNGALVAGYNLLPRDHADGWQLELGFAPRPSLELRARYDRLNRATDGPANERRFEILTVGGRYFFSSKSWVVLDYAFRDFSAPELPGDSLPNRNLEGVGDRVAVRLYHLLF
jgi:hypothetical protein